MKDIGIIALLSVIVSAAAPNAPIYGVASTAPMKAAAPAAQPAPLVVPASLAGKPAKLFVTAKSTTEFGSCFADKQDERALPWWFVPKHNGGTFSNLGARTMKSAYFVVISDRGLRREVRLEGNGAGESAVNRAVSQCV